LKTCQISKESGFDLPKLKAKQLDQTVQDIRNLSPLVDAFQQNKEQFQFRKLKQLDKLVVIDINEEVYQHDSMKFYNKISELNAKKRYMDHKKKTMVKLDKTQPIYHSDPHQT
jgi:hypothetical protein